MKAQFLRIGFSSVAFAFLGLVCLFALFSGYYTSIAKNAAWRQNNALDFPQPIYKFAITHDGKTIAAIGRSSQIDLYDADGLTLISSIDTGRNIPLDIDVLAQDETIVVTYRSGLVETWRKREGKWSSTQLGSRETSYSCCACARVGGLAATGDDAGNIDLWNLRRSTRIGTLPVAGDLSCLEFFPDGRRLLAATDQGAAAIWDVRSRRLVTLFKSRGPSIRAATVSADGRLVLTGDIAGRLILWNPTTGAKIWEESIGRYGSKHLGLPIRFVRFSPINRNLAVAAVGLSLFAFDVPSGRCRTTIDNSSSAWFSHLQFSPDGTALYSSDFRGELQSRDVTQFDGF